MNHLKSSALGGSSNQVKLSRKSIGGCIKYSTDSILKKTAINKAMRLIFVL